MGLAGMSGANELRLACETLGRGKEKDWLCSTVPLFNTMLVERESSECSSEAK